jgi:hypothetical protein
MVDRALGMDQTYYETECPDVSWLRTVEAFLTAPDYQPSHGRRPDRTIWYR